MRASMAGMLPVTTTTETGLQFTEQAGQPDCELQEEGLVCWSHSTSPASPTKARELHWVSAGIKSLQAKVPQLLQPLQRPDTKQQQKWDPLQLPVSQDDVTCASDQLAVDPYHNAV